MKIMTTQECATAIGRIKATGTVLQARIHAVAVSTLAHIRDHGDTTLATRLLDALPNGQRVKALAYWYGHFSSKKATMSVDKKTGQWTCKLDKDRVPEDFDVEKANMTTFADLTSEKSPETFTVEKLEAMVRRIAEANEADVHPGTNIPKVQGDAIIIASELVARLREKKAEMRQKKAA